MFKIFSTIVIISEKDENEETRHIKKDSDDRRNSHRNQAEGRKDERNICLISEKDE